MLVFPTLGLWRPWEAFVRLFAVIPATLLFSLGLAVGAAVSWFGWNSIPTRPVSPLEAAGTADA
jgi:hypothetical protein